MTGREDVAACADRLGGCIMVVANLAWEKGDAARADWLEECHRLFQRNGVSDRTIANMKIVVARGNHARFLALAE